MTDTQCRFSEAKAETRSSVCHRSKLSVLLLDEPTSGLDYLQMNAVGQILNQLKEEGRTIITVTHDSEFIECCCDNVIHMEEV